MILRPAGAGGIDRLPGFAARCWGAAKWLTPAIQDQDTVSWKSSTSGYFEGRERHFSCLDFIAQVTLHIPPRGRHLVRRYGLYSSRGRGTWKDRPALCTRAPQHWYGRQAAQPPTPTDAPKDQEVSTLCSKKAWARLLAKVYELDVMACPKCSTDYVWR